MKWDVHLVLPQTLPIDQLLDRALAQCRAVRHPLFTTYDRPIGLAGRSGTMDSGAVEFLLPKRDRRPLRNCICRVADAGSLAVPAGMIAAEGRYNDVWTLALDAALHANTGAEPTKITGQTMAAFERLYRGELARHPNGWLVEARGRS